MTERKIKQQAYRLDPILVDFIDDLAIRNNWTKTRALEYLLRAGVELYYPKANLYLNAAKKKPT